MNARDLFDILTTASKLVDVRNALNAFRENPNVSGIAFGRPNNRGAIEVAANPARSAIERVTNGHDALLELEHLRHSGKPECRSPREAAEAWFEVPSKDGLSGLTPKARQALAKNLIVRLEPGEGWQSRTLTVIDTGIGIEPAHMKHTILSLNESNKIQKHYLAGTYGQGGASTLTFSNFVFIASRAYDQNKIGFTVAWYEDLPADEFKTGRYVYLVQGTDVLVVDAEPGDMGHGTLIRHFGYDLTTYTSSIGPKSIYGALQGILFDPVLPIRFENKVAGWNRTIKGSRNALNGATDSGDDETGKGPPLDYHLPMFSVSLGDHGDIGIEYWLLARPEVKEGKKPSKPSRVFVDDSKPIILTHNGQNQGELSGRIIKKDADLPFLQTQGRLIVHINCDRLSPGAKRLLFSSTRERTREGFIQSTVQSELVELLKSDDELRRLNDIARKQSLKDKDEAAERQLQRQVARLLRVVGPAFVDIGGPKGDGGTRVTPSRPYPPHPKPEPIQPKEPPTYIRIIGDKDSDIRFFAGQRKYIRVETDANSGYHDPDDPQKSRLNIAVSNDLQVFGTSPLRGGRMRIGIQCRSEVVIGSKGGIRVELYRAGLPALSDERSTVIVQPPKPKEDRSQTPFPKFQIIPVEGPDDENWENVRAGDDEDNDIRRHASKAQLSDGVLLVYYSRVFPRFVTERAKLEQQSPALVESFVRRYELWLAVHALLMYEDEQTSEVAEEKAAEEMSRQERCRLAAIAAMVAAQEVKTGVNTEDVEEAA